MVSRPSIPTPPRPSLPACPSLPPFPRPSPPSLAGLGGRLGALCRPSAATVETALALAALGTGAGIVASAAYTAADAVLPLALLRGFFEGLTP